MEALVRLHGDQALLGLDGVAGLDQHFDDGHFGEVADVGHLDVDDCYGVALALHHDAAEIRQQRGKVTLKRGRWRRVDHAVVPAQAERQHEARRKLLAVPFGPRLLLRP